MLSGLIIIGVVLLVVISFPILIYNKLVTLKNRFKNAYSQIDVQLKRRYDIIPNLVETAKGYLKHERETLEKVIQARNQASAANQRAAGDPADPGAIKRLTGAEGLLTGALGRMFAVMESYPDLKANDTMNRLMEELTSTENRVSFARQAYNDSAMEYNITCEKFPNTVLAGSMGFKPAELFEIAKPEEREAVRVAF
jgi:LemA protein